MGCRVVSYQVGPCNAQFHKLTRLPIDCFKYTSVVYPRYTTLELGPWFLIQIFQKQPPPSCHVKGKKLKHVYLRFPSGPSGPKSSGCLVGSCSSLKHSILLCTAVVLCYNYRFNWIRKTEYNILLFVTFEATEFSCPCCFWNESCLQPCPGQRYYSCNLK